MSRSGLKGLRPTGSSFHLVLQSDSQVLCTLLRISSLERDMVLISGAVVLAEYSISIVIFSNSYMATESFYFVILSSNSSVVILSSSDFIYHKVSRVIVML